MIYKTLYKSPISELTLASDGEYLVGLWLESQKYFAHSIKEPMVENHNLKIFQETKIWLDKYFAGEKPVILGLKLAPKGSTFRQEVWKLLCEIPYGRTVTYSDLAAKIAAKQSISKMSAQAIGGAVGHNPISIIIPCHRVVGKNGNLTGYAGGLDAKIKLLKHEGVLE